MMEEKAKNEMTLEEKVEVLEMILDKLPFEVWYKNTAGEYIYVNKSFADNLGKKPQECIGKLDYEIFGDAEAIKYRQGDWEFLFGDNKMAQQYTNSDGSLTMEFKSAVENENGKFSGIVGCDIENKLDEIQALLMADHRYAFRTVFECSPFGMALYINNSPVPSDVNKKFCDILGISKYSALNTDWRFLTHPDDIAKNEEYLTKFKAGALESFEMEKRFLRPSGDPVWTKMNVLRLYSEVGKPDMNLCILEEMK